MDSDSIGSIAYSPDSKEIFVALDIETISLWRAFLNEWPYTVGALSLLLVVINLFLLRRILAQPRKKGRTYCRKCNHEVSNPAIPCTECGAPLDSRRALIMGKSFRRRTAPIFTLLAIVTIGYGVLWVTPNSLYAPMWGWFNGWSDGTLRLAQRHNIAWLAKHKEYAIRITVIDVATGKRTRDLGTYFGPRQYWEGLRLTVSLDGKCLYLPDRNWRDLLGVSTQTGRALHRLRIGGNTEVTQIAGLSRDGGTVYCVFQDCDTNRTVLVRWDIHTDTHSVVTGVDGKLYSPKLSRHPARFYLIDGPPNPTFLRLPAAASIVDETMHGVIGAENVPQSMWVFKESDPTHPRELQAPITFGNPSVVGDPPLVGLQTQKMGFDLIDFRRHARQSGLPGRTFVGISPFAIATRRFVIGPTTYRSLDFVDVLTGARVDPSIGPSLSTDPSGPLSLLMTAPDLTSFAAHHKTSSGSYRGLISELLIYDLTPYPKLRELEFGTSDEPTKAP